MKITLQRRLAPLALAATLVAGVTLSDSAAFAQKASASQNDLQTRTKNRVAGLFDALESRVLSLHLSGAQTSKLKGIAQKNGPVLPAIWNGSSLSAAQKKSRVRALGSDVNAVFTPAQKQKIAAAKRESVGQLIGAASWLSSELNLSVAQQNQMQSIAMTSYQKMRAPGRGAAENGAVRDVVSGANAQFTRILTPPQQSKWRTIQKAAGAEFVRRANFYRAMLSS